MLSNTQAQSVTVVAERSLNEVLEAFWPKIARTMASAEAEPQAEPLTAEEALDVTASALEPVVLAVFEDRDSPALVTKLAYHLVEQCVPAVFVVSGDARAAEGLELPGVVVLEPETTPVEIGAMLRALSSACGIARAVRSELHSAYRAHGGATGEIEKLHEEMSLAAAVQRGLLPEAIPKIDGYDFGVLFRPASYVSGDIYDVAPLDEHRFAFFVADAVGHGVPASLLTMLLARAFHTIQERALREGDVLAPADVLAEVNAELIRLVGDHPRFASAMYGIMDRRDNVVTIAGAGHPAAIVFSPSGYREVNSVGGLLGVMPDDHFEQTSFVLEDSETLVIYTDGFEMAFPDDDEILASPRPTTKYVDVFASMAERIRSETVESGFALLSRGLDAQRGSLHQVDDLTALAIHARRKAGARTKAA